MRKKPYRRKSGGKYYIDFYEVDSTGEKVRRTRSTGTTDFSVAKQILKEKQSLAALGKFSVSSAGRNETPISEALSRYMRIKEAGKISKDWKDRIERVITDCFCVVSSLKNVSQIRDIHLETYISKLVAEGYSDSVRAKHERIIRTFVTWLSRGNIIKSDPLQAADTLTKNVQPVMRRRMILPQEFDWLQHTLETEPENRHASRKAGNQERLACYMLAVRTGLRSSEIAALKVNNFDFSSSRPLVRLDGRFTKNGETATQYLDKRIAARMLKLVGDKGLRSTDPVFNLPQRQARSEMLRRDFLRSRELWQEENPDAEDAGDFLQAVNSKGEVINFHCLRHTCGAWLAQAGVNIKTIQSIMRHKTITLTMDTYGHLFPDAEVDAIIKTEFFSSPERSKLLK